MFCSFSVILHWIFSSQVRSLDCSYWMYGNVYVEIWPPCIPPVAKLTSLFLLSLIRLLQVRRTVLQWQRRMETWALSDLRLWQWNPLVRRGDLRGHNRLRRPHHPRRRVLPYLPRGWYNDFIRFCVFVCGYLALWRHLVPLYLTYPWQFMAFWTRGLL